MGKHPHRVKQTQPSANLYKQQSKDKNILKYGKKATP
jgi:hypothetical protein